MSSQAEQLQQLVGFFKVDGMHAPTRTPERRSQTARKSKVGLVQSIVKPLKDAIPAPALHVDEASFQRF
jgi:hypothetical protein